MDFWKALQELHTERQRLNNAIAVLEKIREETEASGAARRGRRTMPPEERRVVAERMRAYWARKKGNRQNASTPNGRAM